MYVYIYIYINIIVPVCISFMTILSIFNVALAIRAFLVAQMVKNPPAMWETWVPSLGWEDPLKKGMATHSSLLAWRISWTEESGRQQSMGSQRVGHD